MGEVVQFPTRAGRPIHASAAEIEAGYAWMVYLRQIAEALDGARSAQSLDGDVTAFSPSE